MSRDDRDRHVSQMMVDILTAASAEAGASVRELVAGARRAGGTRMVAGASVSRAIRRLWRQGAVELRRHGSHDERSAAAGARDCR